jgi:hypothetical protein
LKQNFPFQLAAPSKKVAKVPAYYDDYYYDYQPLRPVQPKPQKNRRQGTGGRILLKQGQNLSRRT